MLTSWNNKQARSYGDPATGQQYSSIYRSQLLDNNLNYYLRLTGGKLTLPDVVNAMGVAGTQDLRGVEVLPDALQILGRQTDPALATAVAQLSAWAASGAHRINRPTPARTASLAVAPAGSISARRGTSASPGSSRRTCARSRTGACPAR